MHPRSVWIWPLLLAGCLAIAPAAELPGSSSEDFQSLFRQFQEEFGKAAYARAEKTAKQMQELAERRWRFDPGRVAEALNCRGVAVQYQGRYAEAKALFERALEHFHAAGDDGHDGTAMCSVNLGNLYKHQAQYAQAEPYFKRALSIYIERHGEHSIEVADCLDNMAPAYAEQGLYEKAGPLLRRALAIRERAFGKDDPRVSVSLNNLATLLLYQEEYTQAEPLYRRALAINRAGHNSAHPDIAMSLNNLANLYWHAGRYDEAEPLLHEAVKMYERTLGEQHPDVAYALANLAKLYHASGRLAEALSLHDRALEIRKRAFGDEHLLVAHTLQDKAILYYRQRRYADAETILRQALSIFGNAADNRLVNQAACLSNLGMVYAEHGLVEQAGTCFEQAVEVYRETLGDDHTHLANSLHGLGCTYHLLGRYVEAERCHREAMAIRKKRLGDRHSAVITSLNSLAALSLAQDNYSQASELLDRAVSIVEQEPHDRHIAWKLYFNRAKLAWQNGLRHQAEEDLEKAAEIVERLRGHAAGSELERAEFFGGWRDLFEQTVAWQDELGNLEKVLEAMERSRARAFVDQLETARMIRADGQETQPPGSADLQRQEANAQISAIRDRLNHLAQRQELTDLEREAQRQGLLAQLQLAKADFVEAEASIRSTSPAYRLAVSKDFAPCRLEHLKYVVVDPKALLLEYLLGTKGGYVLIVPADGPPRLETLTLDGAQAERLRVEPGPLTAKRMGEILMREDETGVLDQLRASNDPRREQQAVEGLAVLWELLVPEAERQAIIEGKYKRLVVLPDAALAMLPFETLVVEPGEEHKYLLDAGPPIIYAPSATILVNLAERQEEAKQPAEQPVLSIGDCRYGSPVPPSDTLLANFTPQTRYTAMGGQLTPLKYAGWEVQWVGDVFRKRGARVGQLRGDAASELAVRQYAPGRRVLHFATHGLVDQQYGNLFGALGLTPGPRPDDPADDGFLTLAEIYELDLAGCELAILSACDTNVGPHQRGEGVWTLSRGFLTAGARRVAASSWLLDDEVAASTVSYFCASVARQQATGGQVDYAAALHEAKRWARSVKTEKHDWSSPYYWAPMVLVGPQ